MCCVSSEDSGLHQLWVIEDQNTILKFEHCIGNDKKSRRQLHLMNWVDKYIDKTVKHRRPALEINISICACNAYLSQSFHSCLYIYLSQSVPIAVCLCLFILVSLYLYFQLFICSYLFQSLSVIFFLYLFISVSVLYIFVSIFLLLYMSVYSDLSNHKLSLNICPSFLS